ncbi:MAG: oligogalacturonate lyase family protein [Nibricoccus sp.]
MKFSRFLPLLLWSAVCVGISASQAAESLVPQNKSDEPPTSWIDPDTGHRVIRLTREPGSASLYFNENAYTPDGHRMIYTTPDGISVIDLNTFQTRRVVEGRVRAIIMGHKTPTVFYLKSVSEDRPRERSLYSTNIDTGETKKLADLPPRGGIAAVNADETFAAGTYIEGDSGQDYNERPRTEGNQDASQGHSLDQPKNKGQMMEERLAARLPIVLFTVDLRSGKINPILHSTDWVNHLLFSPTDPNLLMYCHEGPWHKVDRIWTIRTDGSQNTLIHKRTMVREIAGHEFFSHDGKTVWYDLQTPRGEVFWVGGYNLGTGARTWFNLQRNEWSIHFNVSPDGKLFCGDGGDSSQVAKAPDGRWIYLFRPELVNDSDTLGDKLIRAGVFRSERLVNMSKHDYKLEPNVSFTPDQKYIIFRSNMFGPTYVFAVEVARAK